MSDDRGAFCQWTRDHGSLKCSRCGRAIAAVAGSRDPLAICPNGSPITGDVVENVIDAAGLPEERTEAVAAASGPGTELHALLRDWLGIEPTRDCPCRSMARKMDTRGPEWCESDDGMAEILAVMRAEHGKRWADGRTILPWTDMGARQLVLLACRRARSNS